MMTSKSGVAQVLLAVCVCLSREGHPEAAMTPVGGVSEDREPDLPSLFAVREGRPGCTAEEDCG